MNHVSNHHLVFLAALALICFAAGIASAATVTQGITYQGKLTGASGNPLTGTYSVKFSLYEAATGGTALVSVTQSVNCTNGQFTTPIAFDQKYYDGRALWLGVKVWTDPEMTPRQEIRPVPYALGLRPGVVGASFTTGSAGTTSADRRYGVNVTTLFDFNTAVQAATAGDASTGMNVSTKGYNSHGVYVTTKGDSSYGVIAITDGSDSDGLYAYTDGLESEGVSVITKGSWSEGVKVATYSSSSPGVAVVTSGISSNGVRAYTSGIGSSGVDVETSEADSPGMYAVTAGSTSNGVYVVTNGLNSHGVYAGTNNDYSNGGEFHTSGTGSNGIYARTAGNTAYGIKIYTTGPNSRGVDVSTVQSTAVYADTGNADHKYGVQTPDIIRAFGYETGSSDVAEYMAVAGDAGPGTVVIIGNDGRLAPASAAYDTRVAGIISTDPGVFLGAKDDGNPGEALIAVAGRVPCRVDATRAPVHAGDLLTTSDNPGHAMKALPVDVGGVTIFRPGTIIGKALGSLESGTGTIEVLVTLQ